MRRLYEPGTDWIPSSLVWTVQLGAVVRGHIVGARAGHIVATRDARHRTNVRLRQIPLAALMVTPTATIPVVTRADDREGADRSGGGQFGGSFVTSHGRAAATLNPRPAPALLSTLGLLVVLLGLLLVDPTATWAASPSPDAASGGDPRSSGQGPGFVGDAWTAILATLAIGVASVVITSIYVRLTPRRRPDDT